MDHADRTGAHYDPAQHDSHVVAVLADSSAVAEAWAALTASGLPEHAIEVLDGGEVGPGAAALEGLFIPERDAREYHLALAQGHAIVVVRPEDAAQRDAAIAALEARHPLDLDVHVERWRNPPAEGLRPGWNHANVSRADMRDRSLPGRDALVRDMTGKPMTVRVMSEQEMAETPYRPRAARVETTEQPPSDASPRPAPVASVSYTHGVPLALAERLSPEEQVMAQSPATAPTTRQFVRHAEERPVIGWRDRPSEARGVRSYVAERAGETGSWQLFEKGIKGGSGGGGV